MIPAASPQKRLKRYSAAVDRAVRQALDGPSLILGERVEALDWKSVV